MESAEDPNQWIRLNVGGCKFETTKSTLIIREPNSMLAKMLDTNNDWKNRHDKDDYLLIDRSGRYFDVILNYLRHGKIILDTGLMLEGLKEEAEFYCMEHLINQIEEKKSSDRELKDNAPLTRRDVINLIAGVPASYSSHSLVDHGATGDSVPRLRLQGVNLQGADLSYLDLRRINFRHANLTDANLSHSNVSECDFTKATMRRAIINKATLRRVNMSCACLENAQLVECDFEDPCEQPAYLELANLKYADLSGARLFKAELRVASLKHARLREADLRRATLAGADLEYCDLTGSDLHEANLRSANFKNAIMEGLRTPIHMTQTVQPY